MKLFNFDICVGSNDGIRGLIKAENVDDAVLVVLKYDRWLQKLPVEEIRLAMLCSYDLADTEDEAGVSTYSHYCYQ